MDFKTESRILKEVLELENEPVAVAFTNQRIEGSPERISMCKALKEASEGKDWVIDPENSACPGGTWHCGLGEVPSGAQKRRLQNFLTRGEKLFHSIAVFERMMKLSSPAPSGLSDRIFMGPLYSAPLRPDIVLFLCNSDQACRIITLDSYWDGIPPKTELTGALCHSAISYPVISGQTNLTVGDWTARRHQNYGKDILFVSVPYERINNLIKSIPLCTAGKAELEIPDDFDLEI